jgi:cephalosporin hydroxylase
MNPSLIEDVWKTTTGWCTWEKARVMVSVVMATRPDVCLEIGIFHGRSALPVALAQKMVGKGRFIAIDPWKASASVEGQSKVDTEWWNHQDMHEKAYDDFMGKRDYWKLQDVIEVHRMTSDEYDPKFEIGLLSVDGNHGEQAIKDVARYAPCIIIGGFLIIDDLKWNGGAVTRAVGLLPDMGFKELFRVENSEECWAMFQRVKL